MRAVVPALAASLLLAPLLLADAAVSGGTVRGSVEVLRQGLFGGLSPSEDRGGVVVYVTGFQTGAPPDAATLDQQEEQFHPRILPIVAGQTVRFPNRDPVYHNVFSVSSAQPFDLGQYRATDPPRVQVFARPGLVPVYCNIHPQMISYLVVLENDAFAVTEADGAFALRVPAGSWTLNAWAPGAERASQPVQVEAGAEVAVSLRLALTERIPTHRRKDGSPYPPAGYEEER